jgi:hypothetical protein
MPCKYLLVINISDRSTGYNSYVCIRITPRHFMNLHPEGWLGMVKKKQEINTGVINPYAFVASRKGRKYDWKNIEAGEKKKLLETVFRCKYHKLFDPQHGSPLFSSRNSPRDSAKFQSGGTGETRCTAAVQNWLPNAAGTFSSPNPPPGINDAVQGCSLNCWFVAALASVAWTWPDYIKTWLAGQCRLRLYRVTVRYQYPLTCRQTGLTIRLPPRITQPDCHSPSGVMA